MNSSKSYAPRNNMLLGILASVAVLGGLGWVLFGMSNADDDVDEIMLFCAAGIRPAVEPIAKEYEREYGVKVRINYAGSDNLLNQLTVEKKTGDLYLAADASYIKKGQAKGIVKEELPLGTMKPVIAVKKGNPKEIQGVADLLRSDVTCAIGDPKQAAVGRKARKLLTASGHWEVLEERVTDEGVFHGTVPEVANAVKVGNAIDAGIIWDATAKQYADLEVISTPELDAGLANITVGVLTSSEKPSAALRFARYMSARDRGLKTFADKGFETVEGDVWNKRPEINFFAGAVNRRALEPIVEAFQEREGVTVNVSYDGCGILIGKMKPVKDQDTELGFPDIFMACDVYYLNAVQEWFEEGINVSDTEIVIAVPKDNPQGIESLADLGKPGVRVTVGEPDQCTIGVLTKHLLKTEGVYESVKKNIVTETPSSANLIPSVTIENAADATLAYHTDTLAEQDKLKVIRIDSPAAKAIQPYSISKTSKHKHLARRLYQAVADSREAFEAAGFNWRLGDKTAAQASVGQKPHE